VSRTLFRRKPIRRRLMPLQRPPIPECPEALPARPAGVLLLGGRTDSHDRTSRLNIASRLTSRCRRCGSKNVARTSFAASSRSVAARSRPYALPIRSMMRLPARRFISPVPVRLFDPQRWPALCPSSRSRHAADPARAPCGRALLAAGAEIPTIAHRALIARQG
jgi:hypothetical protein